MRSGSVFARSQGDSTANGMSLIRTASDLIAIEARGRRITNAPTRFDGTLDGLFERYIARNVLSVESVAEFHRRLVEYVSGEDPLFLIRMIRDTERRQIYVTGDGSRFKATDNAPAWWTHSALFQKAQFDAATFPTVIETIPAHFHDVAQFTRTANASGWHFAHIFDVKNRNTDYPSWRRRDVIAGFLRSVHPCNYFLIQKTEWQRWGGDEQVIGYFGALHAERYADVWNEFAARVRTSGGSRAKRCNPVRDLRAPASDSALNADDACSTEAAHRPGETEPTGELHRDAIALQGISDRTPR